MSSLESLGAYPVKATGNIMSRQNSIKLAPLASGGSNSGLQDESNYALIDHNNTKMQTVSKQL